MIADLNITKKGDALDGASAFGHNNPSPLLPGIKPRVRPISFSLPHSLSLAAEMILPSPVDLSWEDVFLVLLDDDSFYAERLRQVEAAFHHSSDGRALQGLLAQQIHRARIQRRRILYRGRIRALLKLLTLACLFTTIHIVHSSERGPEFLQSVSLRSLIDRHTYKHSPLSPVTPFESQKRDFDRGRRKAGELPDGHPGPTDPRDQRPFDPDQNLHPDDLSRIAGHDDPREKLKDCFVRPAPANRLHFRAVGEITGNDGMIHFGMNFNISELLFNLAEFCKLPKQVVSHLHTIHAQKQRLDLVTSSRSDPDHSRECKNSNDTVCPKAGHSFNLHLIYENLAHRCEMLMEETTSFYHIFMGGYVHGKQVDELWTLSDEAHGSGLPFYSHNHFIFPEKEAKLTAELYDYVHHLPNCSSNNPYGDPRDHATWDRIFATRKEYNESMYPLRPSSDGGCEIDITAWNTIYTSLMMHRRVGIAPFSEDDLEPRRRRRRRRRRRSTLDADYLSEAAERIKRFILTLLFAVVAIGSLLFTKIEMDNMAARANHNTDSTVKLFNEQDHAIRINKQAIDTMNKTITSIKDALDGTIMHVYGLQMTFRLYSVMDTYFEEHVRMLRGLTRLLDHRLSPDLLRADALTQTIIEKREEFARIGYSLGIESLDDIFRATTSWVVYGNASLFIATHIPVYRSSTRYKLLEPDKHMYFAPTAQDLAEMGETGAAPQLAFRVEAEKELLAISRDGRFYQTLTWVDMEKCSRVGVLYMCPGANIIKQAHSESTSCLIALYKGAVEQIRTLCKWKSVTRSHYALQTSGNRYIVRVAEPTTVRFVCGEGTTRPASGNVVPINETALIQVAGMCQAYVDDYILEGRLEFSVKTTAYETQMLRPEDLLHKLLNDTGMIKWNVIRDFRPQFDPDGIPFNDVSSQFVRLSENHASGFIRDIVTLCLCVGLGVVMIVVFMKCILPYLRERRKTSTMPHPDDVPRPQEIGRFALMRQAGKCCLLCCAPKVPESDEVKAARERYQVAHYARLLADERRQASDRYHSNLAGFDQSVPPPDASLLKQSSSVGALSRLIPLNDLDLHKTGPSAPQDSRRHSRVDFSHAEEQRLEQDLLIADVRKTATDAALGAVAATGLIRGRTGSMTSVGAATGTTRKPAYTRATTPSASSLALGASSTALYPEIAPPPTPQLVPDVRRKDVLDILERLSSSGNSQIDAMKALAERRTLEPAKQDLLQRLLAAVQATGHPDSVTNFRAYPI